MNKLVRQDDKPLSIDSFPPLLQQLAEHVIKKGNVDTIKIECETLNLNYDSVLEMLYQQNKKGKNLWQLVREKLKTRDALRLIKVENSIYGKSQNNALSVDTKAAELFLKLKGEIQAGNKKRTLPSINRTITLQCKQWTATQYQKKAKQWK